ncbi:MAG: DegQ family serine endoprotease [Pseudomonadota bacterium]
MMWQFVQGHRSNNVRLTPQNQQSSRLYQRQWHPVHSLFLILGLVFWAATTTMARDLPDFTELSAKNSPAVVNISTQHKLEVAGSGADKGSPDSFNIPGLPENSPFHEFFRHFLEKGDPRKRPPRRGGQSLGSGFIISEDGYILTNHHVVTGADEIEVKLNDRRYFAAKVIGSDEESDVALIKIEATDLPTVKIGKSSQLKVGEWVLAIGSPFGFDYTVTAGIVSAKGRSLPSENYVPFIQTDVAINPGNSGGPLFNLDGEVIGINSQIYSRTGGFMGLSFAIPIELAMSVADQLRDNGSVSRGYLGVLIQNVDRNLAESFGLDQPTGALVSKVLPETPAAEADLQEGDIILTFNEQKIHDSNALPPMVGASRVNDEVKITLLRNGKTLKKTIRIGQLPDSPDMAGTGSVDVLGLSVTDLSAEVRKRSKVKEGGVLIRQVKKGSGREAGLRRGDIIRMYAGEKVENARDFADKVVASKDKKSVAILIQRKGEPMFLALRQK